MPRRRITVVASIVLVATPAFAAPLIVTPALRPPSGGHVRCIVANASPTKVVEYTRTIYEFNGSAANGPVTHSIAANSNLSTGPTVVAQGHCVVEVLKGGKRSVRVTLQVHDSGGALVSAVEGQ